MIVLGIETSCDDTGVAIFDSEKGLLSHKLYSQIVTHAEFGGVVPELASRDHCKHILPLVTATLLEANIKQNLIEGVAYTAGPGLVGALLVGAAFARSFAWALGIPALGVHHMEGHLLAPCLEERAPQTPYLALLVSGGHTQIVQVNAVGSYEILGESIDDAAGEAFDKTAKLLGLEYPGGPKISALAVKGSPDRFHFTRPMLNRPGLDFSFSGLKTAVLTLYKKQETIDEQTKADIARAFEDCVVDTLVAKCKRAIEQTHTKQLVIAGGVSANKKLRQELKTLTEKLNVELFFPRHEFCTDNGAMIAYAGCARLMAGEKDDLTIRARARWPITELEALSS